MSLFGRKSTSGTSPNERLVSSEEISAVMARLIGVWRGRVTHFDGSHHSNKVGAITKRFHPSPDGWHIIANNSTGSERARQEDFEVIALHPTRNEITFTEFAAGRSTQIIYSLLECTNTKNAAKLVLQSMGWDKEEPCEIRQVYDVSNRTLVIETQIRPATKGGTFHTVECVEMSRSS